MERDRRQILRSAGVAGLTAMAGCVGGFGGSGSKSGTNVGMIYATGGLGDDSFNDMAQQGLKQAKDKFSVSSSKVEPSSPGEFDGAQRRFAESGNYDLINCIGFAQEGALKSNAKAYPDQKFMIVDAEVKAENVRSYLFNEPAGSFQVGHLAGLLTDMEFAAGAGKTNPGKSTVGFVGGTESPLIKSFEVGFKAGVKHANSNATVLSSYVGDFNDTAGGQETARSMYQSGADIVFHAAGRTGIGVFQAAQSEGRFAIGVDDDQSVSQKKYANVILASMVKRVDEAVFSAIKSVVNDSFEGGKTKQLGLKNGGIETVYGQSIGGQIPDKVKNALEKSRQQIIDGQIDVPQKA